MYSVEYDGTKNKVSILIASLREEEVRKRLKEYDDLNIEIPYEIVVVSPFPVWQYKIKDKWVNNTVIWIEEKEVLGNVNAMDLAFKASTGNYIIFMADDVTPQKYAIENIFYFTRMRPEIFMGSFTMIDENNLEQEPWYIQKYLYACYGCIARKDIEKIGGFFDTRFKHSWCDPDLAMRVWTNNGRVEKCSTAVVINRQMNDYIHLTNTSKYFELDTQVFLEKWHKTLEIDRNTYWGNFNKSRHSPQEIYDRIKEEKYYCDTYDNTKKPLISFLVSCRIFDEREFEPASCLMMDKTDRFNLHTLLDSFIWATQGKFNDEVEFIIKLDSDNEIALQRYVKDNILKSRYPDLQIRFVVFDRWEGRNSLTETYRFLFSRKNPSSQFVGFLSDDSILYKNQETNLNIMDIIHKYANNKDYEYSILTSHCREFVPGDPRRGWVMLRDYYNDRDIWTTGDLTEPYPIISTKLLEVMNSMGNQINIDATFSMLTVMMKTIYNMDIRVKIEGWILRGNKIVEGDGYTTKFNDENTISIDQFPDKENYFWTLARQMAKNIYLNKVNT